MNGLTLTQKVITSNHRTSVTTILRVPGTSNVLVTLFLSALSGKIKRNPQSLLDDFGDFFNGWKQVDGRFFCQLQWLCLLKVRVFLRSG